MLVIYMLGMMSYCSMILWGDVFPTLSPSEASGLEQEFTEADVFQFYLIWPVTKLQVGWISDMFL